MVIKISDARKKLVFKEPMITLEDLLQRWTGIKPYELQEIIKETIYYSKEDRQIVECPDYHGILRADTTPRFRYNIPPYYIDKILEDEDGKNIYYCRLVNWATVKGMLKYPNYGHRVGFKFTEIEHYEKKHPEVLYKMKDLSSVRPEKSSIPLGSATSTASQQLSAELVPSSPLLEKGESQMSTPDDEAKKTLTDKPTIVMLTEEKAIIEAIEGVMETVNRNKRKCLEAVIMKLQGKTYTSIYLQMLPNTKAGPSTLTKEGKKYCEKGYVLAISLGINFNRNLLF